VIQGIFIIHEPCRFNGVEGTKSYFILMTLMRGKYLLHIINKMKIWYALGKVFIHR
jgi:hypothetical protein